MTVNPDGVIERLDIFEDQSISPADGLNAETVQPFPLDQGMEGFDTGIIVGIAFMAIAQLELFCGVLISLGNKLAAAV